MKINKFLKRKKKWLSYKIYNIRKEYGERRYRSRIKFSYLADYYKDLRNLVAEFELRIICPIKASIFYDLYYKIYIRNKIFERITTFKYQKSKFSKFCGYLYSKQKDVERSIVFSFQKSKYYKIYYWTYYVEERRFEQNMVFKYKFTRFYRTSMLNIYAIWEFLYIMIINILIFCLDKLYFFFDLLFIALLIKFIKFFLYIIFNFFLKPLFNYLNKTVTRFVNYLILQYEYNRYNRIFIRAQILKLNNLNLVFIKFVKKNFCLVYKLIPIKLLLSYTSILIFNLVLILCLYLMLMSIPSRSEEIITLVKESDITYTKEIFTNFEKFLTLQEFMDQVQLDIFFAEEKGSLLSSSFYTETRPEHLILAGWAKDESFVGKINFILTYMKDLKNSDFLARSFGNHSHDSFLENFLKSFLTDKNFFICISEKVFSKNLFLEKYIHSLLDNKITLFLDSKLILEEIGNNKFNQTLVIEKNLEFLDFFLSKIKKNLELDQENAIKFNLINNTDSKYSVLNSQNFLFTYKLKFLVWLIVWVHSLFGGLNFLYDYFFKRIQENDTKISLWVIYLNLVIIIFYFLLYVALNFFFIFP